MKLAACRERPVLFSGPMVRAISEGRKTQTRRVVQGVDETYVGVEDGKVWYMDECGDCLDAPCPFGVPGDRLWVRESLLWKCERIDETCVESGHVYAATPDDWVEEYVNQKPMPRKNIPSIHMPRWASRLTLEVVSVRPELLQAISEADAIAEGCEPIPVRVDPIDTEYRAGFAQLWASISGEGSWDANPWVWVVEFKLDEVKR